MSIQSLSIVVPSKKCINNCKFCVACMIDDTKDYKNQMDENLPFYDLYLKDYLKRLNYTKEKGVETIMLTGNCEPQQNRHFLTQFGLLMMLMPSPFRNIEMQTTGVNLDDNYLRFLRNHVGVSTISLSISSFNTIENAIIIDTPYNKVIDLNTLCQSIKKYDFNLRLSINLNKAFSLYTPESLFSTVKLFEADQVTFRVLYSNNSETEQGKWIQSNAYSATQLNELNNYISTNGTELEILPFGLKKYSVNNISTVLDTDCMSTQVKEEMKYLVLRPNCKLYSKWDNKASLIF